jgi:hypothetical protein
MVKRIDAELQSAVVFGDLVNQGFNRCAIIDIQVRPAAACISRQRLGDFGCAIIRGGGANDQVAKLRQLMGNRCANAARSAGHQRNVLFVFTHGFLFGVKPAQF